jgi:hypothetical protein
LEHAARRQTLSPELLFVLAKTLRLPSDTVVLHPGIVMNRQSLLLELWLGRGFQPTDIWYELAMALVGGGNAAIELPDGGRLTKQQLLLKTIENDAQFADAYVQLAAVTAADGKVALKGRQRAMSRSELLCKALSIDPRCVSARVCLALCLRDNDSTPLPDGRVARKIPLLQEVMSDVKSDTVIRDRIQLLLAEAALASEANVDAECVPHIATSARTVSGTVLAEDLIRRKSCCASDSCIVLGKFADVRHRRKYYLQAVSLDPQSAGALNCLASTLGSTETIAVPCGFVCRSNSPQRFLFGAVHLLVKALSIDCEHGATYLQLAQRMPSATAVISMPHSNARLDRQALRDLGVRFAPPELALPLLTNT